MAKRDSNPNKEKISTQMRYDVILYLKTKYIADMEFRSLNAQIEYFMKQGIEEYEKKYGVIDVGELPST